MARKVYDTLGLHGRVSLPQAVDWSKTKAYTSVRSTGEGISVNLAGREPNGLVEPSDFEGVRDQVAEAVAAFVDPRTGEHPVAKVWRREEVFKGRFADDAPDLLLEASPLYSLTHAKSVVEPADWLSGDHRIDGVFAAAGPTVDRAALADGPFQLVDLAPTILAAAGAPASVAHSGTVLTAVVGEDAARRAGQAAPAAGREGERLAAGLNESEAEEVEEHLRGLGYLE